jgi:hypothetical protein
VAAVSGTADSRTVEVIAQVDAGGGTPLGAIIARKVERRLTEAGLVVLPNDPDHFVTFDEQGWFIEHSTACRVEGTIGTCEYNAAVRVIDDEFDPELLGRWRITGINEGLPDLEAAPRSDKGSDRGTS